MVAGHGVIGVVGSLVIGSLVIGSLGHWVIGSLVILTIHLIDCRLLTIDY